MNVTELNRTVSKQGRVRTAAASGGPERYIFPTDLQYSAQLVLQMVIRKSCAALADSLGRKSEGV